MRLEKKRNRRICIGFDQRNIIMNLLQKEPARKKSSLDDVHEHLCVKERFAGGDGQCAMTPVD